MQVSRADSIKFREITEADDAILAGIIRTNLEAAIHIYEKCGYKLIGQPKEAVHSTMNRFFIKDL